MNHKIARFLLAASMLLLASCTSLLASQPTPQTIPEKNTSLSPGSVHLVEEPNASQVVAWLIYPQGEADNPYQEGLAHYLEHLVWYNSFNEPGAFRHSNAWTKRFSTGYWIQSSLQGLGQSLSKLFATAAPINLDQRFMEQERDIVLREYDKRISEDAYAPLFDEIRRTLFAGSGLSRSLIGGKQDIARFLPDQAKALHRQSHQLQDAALLVYGNLSRDELEAVLNDTLPNVPKSNPKIRSNGTPVDLTKKTFRNDGKQTLGNLPAPLFAYQQLVPLAGCNEVKLGYADCDAAIDIINDLLSSSLPGGLAAPLRFDQFIASRYNVWLERVGQGEGNSYLLLGFDAEPDVGISLKELQQAFEQQWQKIIVQGIPETSLERIKKRYLDDFEKNPVIPANRLSLILQQLGERQTIYALEDYRRAIAGMNKKKVDALLASFKLQGRIVSRRFEKGIGK